MEELDRRVMFDLQLWGKTEQISRQSLFSDIQKHPWNCSIKISLYRETKTSALRSVLKNNIYWLLFFLSFAFFHLSGLKWEDDTTQRVISRELSKLRNVPFHHQSNSPSLLDIYSNSRDRKLKPDQTDLNRNLQKYLTEFLQPLDHQAPVQQEGPKVQVSFSWSTS